MSADTKWGFWCPDEDRNAGWTNHCYCLQWVAEGEGETPEEAWRQAVSPINTERPHSWIEQCELDGEDWTDPTGLVAIKIEHEVQVGAPPKAERV